MKIIMEATIRNKKGKSTLIIKGDFYQILDENFKEICKAITNKVKSLKEMKSLLDADDQILNTIVLIIKKSLTPGAAASKLQEELGMSKMAVKYLLNMPLFTLVSLTAEGIEQELAEYRKQMEAISALCQPEIEFYEIEEPIKK
jgi:DNA gyrase/topoisomerase IV subunit A